MAKLFPKLVSFIAVLLLCQFGYVVCQSTNSSDSPQLPEDEAKALDELMTTLRWNTSQQISRSSCDDKGISCSWSYDQNSTVYHVTGLHLSSRELKGQIDAEALASLVHLEQMILWYNMLSGEIPKELGTLSHLRSMVLGFNELTGQLPPELGRLGSLYALDLSFNNLTGGIPDSMKKLKLSKMFLTGNMLNGTVPSWVTDNIEDKADLSYNNFEIPRDGPKKGERKLNIEPYRNSIRDLKDKCQGKPK
ncbi:hypothetical protein D5086_028681, partial [Populus alba]